MQSESWFYCKENHREDVAEDNMDLRDRQYLEERGHLENLRGDGIHY